MHGPNRTTRENETEPKNKSRGRWLKRKIEDAWLWHDGAWSEGCYTSTLPPFPHTHTPQKYSDVSRRGDVFTERTHRLPALGLQQRGRFGFCHEIRTRYEFELTIARQLSHAHRCFGEDAPPTGEIALCRHTLLRMASSRYNCVSSANECSELRLLYRRAEDTDILK